MLMHEDKRKELTRLLALVDERLAALPARSWEQRHDHDKAVQALAYDLEQQGARFGEQNGNHTVSLGGVRAASTMSIDSALRNWCVGARKRLGGAA